MLDLNGHVVGKIRKLAVEIPNDGNRVPGAVKEVRISEGDVASTRVHLPSDVLQDYFFLDNPKPSLVHRHNRAVTAQVLAATARFRIARCAALSRLQVQVGILRESRQPAAVGYLKA